MDLDVPFYILGQVLGSQTLEYSSRSPDGLGPSGPKRQRLYFCVTYNTGSEPAVTLESASSSTDRANTPAVTFVCRRFRETAVATPRLWSNIAYDLGTQWMLTMMERAMVAPIFLWAHCRNDSHGMGPEVKAYIPKHIFHLQELALSGPEDEIANLSSCLIKPAPMLELLSLNAQTIVFHSSDPPIPVPSVLFDGQTPRLSYIMLHNCVIAWDCPNFKSLTVLRLSLKPFSVYRTTVFLPSVSQLLDIIDQNPLLKILSLEYCLPYLNSPTFPLPSPTRVSKAVHLDDLTLSGRVLDCVQVLQSLSIPATASLHITCDSWDKTDPSLRGGKEACDLIPWLTQHLSPPESEDNVSAQASFSRLSILPRDSVTRPCSINVFLEGSIQNLPIRWDLCLPVAFPSLWNYVQMLNAVFDAVPAVEDVMDLALAFCEFSEEDILTVFRKMQKVEVLAITNIDPLDLLDSIAGALDSTIFFDEDGTLGESIFFPCLKSLSVIDYNCTSFPILEECLTKRKQRGNELEKMHIRRCTVTKSQVNRFYDVVKEVYWDEVEEQNLSGLT
ncbi:hypothetical protein BDP27DRAFT_1451214 [Rhodocollybia butyracea]|uniref:Uncharacterized protein n=1 Tax=Rhodocollybia butyracea TaxID=206335 RepID=A0A9P5U3B4_9AGAR|nr:hypothetical protein BDP27DRAFT_1451214 [Rhodocollybia butyracea]